MEKFKRHLAQVWTKFCFPNICVNSLKGNKLIKNDINGFSHPQKNNIFDDIFVKIWYLHFYC